MFTVIGWTLSDKQYDKVSEKIFETKNGAGVYKDKAPKLHGNKRVFYVTYDRFGRAMSKFSKF